MRRSRFVLLIVSLALISLSAVAAEPWSPPSLADVEAAIDGLGFDDFIETSFRQHILRFPDYITSLGLAAEYGIRNDALERYEHEYLLETGEIERLILRQLSSFDPAGLTEEQRTTYEVSLWYWDDLVRGQAFADYEYLVHYMDIRSAHGLTEFALTERHPFSAESDIVDYLGRLEKVGDQFAEIIQEVERRADTGILVPRLALQWALPAIEKMAQRATRQHPFYTTLAEKGAGIDGVSSDVLDGYLDSAVVIIDGIVKPAYWALRTAVMDWVPQAPVSLSLGQQPDGQDAYAYILWHHTTTDLTAEDIHTVGLREVARVQDEIRSAASALGYVGATDMTSVFDWVAAQSGSVRGDEALEYAESLIAKAARVAVESGALTRLPVADVVAVAVDSGGYYSRPALDGSRPGSYYVTTGATTNTFVQPTIAYHETIPGHHVQIALAQELEMPLIRGNVGFTGFVEGWALYAERLMYELGAYEDDPYGNLGRLQYELLRAVRLVTDTGIHGFGWSRDEAIGYISRTMGVSARAAEYRVMRYTVIPGQATAYMVGMLELLELRERAQTELGDAFDLAAFHDIVLGNGAVPLPFVEGLVDAWIAGQ